MKRLAHKIATLPIAGLVAALSLIVTVGLLLGAVVYVLLILGAVDLGVFDESPGGGVTVFVLLAALLPVGCTTVLPVFWLVRIRRAHLRPAQPPDDDLFRQTTQAVLTGAPQKSLFNPAWFASAAVFNAGTLLMAYFAPFWWARLSSLASLLWIDGILLVTWLVMRKAKEIAASRPLPAHVPSDWRERCIAALTSDGVKSWEDVSTSKLYTSYFADSAKFAARWLLPGIVIGVLLTLLLPDAGVVAVAVFFLACLVVMRSFSRRRLGMIQQDWIGVSAVQTVAGAARPPTFYLRSFDLDLAAARDIKSTRYMPSSEAVLSALLARFGPVLAIGRPGEAEPMRGATRFYVDDAHWRQKIEQLVPCCQFVVWTTGRTEGLQWEIEHLVRSLPPERLLLWLHVHIGKWSKEERRAEWQRVVAIYREIFPQPLPEDIERVYFIGFDRDWKPVAIPGPNYRKTWWDRADMAGFYKMSGLTPYLIDRL
jgi:hypothetical protein